MYLTGRKLKMKGKMIEVIKITTNDGDEFYILSDMLKNIESGFKKMEKIMMNESEYYKIPTTNKAWRLID